MRIRFDREKYSFYFGLSGAEQQMAGTASIRFLCCELTGQVLYRNCLGSVYRMTEGNRSGIVGGQLEYERDTAAGKLKRAVISFFPPSEGRGSNFIDGAKCP